MSATTKIAVGVASGYLLGRTKKLKLAVTVASLLAGQRLASGRGMVEQGSRLLESSPELRRLQDQIRGRLKDAARDAALGVATSRMEQITKALQGPGADESTDEAAQESAEDDAEDQQESVEDPDEAEPEEAPAPRRAPRPAKKAARTAASRSSRSAGGSAPRKRTTGSGR